VDAVRILEKTPHRCAHITPLRHQSGFHVTANEHLSLFNGRTSNWYFYCSVKFSLGYSKRNHRNDQQTAGVIPTILLQKQIKMLQLTAVKSANNAISYTTSGD